MAGIVVADSESLRAANAIDTPEENAQGHTINHIGVFEQGEQIEATIIGEDTYDIGLFDSSDTEVSNETDVSDTVSFNTNDLEPGNYYLSVTNTFFDDIAPVVISGYDIDIELTEDTTQDDLSILATVSETATEGSPHAVEAVAWNDNTEERVELTTDDEFDSTATYDGIVSTDEFDGESYNVYVVALGDEEIYQGENEILAVGEASVSNQDDDSNDSDDTDGTDSGSGDDVDESDESNETDELDDATESIEEPNESDPVSDDSDDDQSVIEPNTSTSEEESGDSDNSEQEDDNSIDEIDDETPHSIVLPVVALLLTTLGIARLEKNY